MKKLLSLIVLTGVAFSHPVGAEEAAKPWKNMSDISLVSSNGNSKATTASAKNVFSYTFPSKTTLELEGGALGSQSQGEITSEQYYAGDKVSQKLSDKNYVFQKFKWDKDRFAGIANRYDSGAGLGRLWFDTPKNQWSTELGAGYVNEERKDAPRNDFGSGRAYTKYVHTFREGTFFSQDGEYIHNFKNSDDYRLNTESALTTALSTHMSFKTSFTWKRVGVPPAGKLRDDTRVMAGLILNY